jgi:alpha-tubulin suppressor-like RCC1 family protein
VNSDARSRAASLRRLALVAPLVVPMLGLAFAGCRKATAPNVPTKLVWSIQPANTPVDSSIVPAVAVVVQDALGEPLTSTTTLVTMAIAANPGGGNMGGSATVATISGIATFPYLNIDKPGAGYTITASITTMPQVAAITSVPFNIVAVSTGSFAQVSTGGNASCGVSAAGAGYCWGNNSLGQLGNGATTNSLTPVKVLGGLAFQSISAGSQQYFACGLTTAGVAYCWGYNDYGQLGNGTLTNAMAPLAVKGNLTFTSLSAGGGGQACGLVAGGAAYCWGANASGQLGVGTGAFSTTPLPVSGGLSFANISAGENGTTCGVTLAGAGFCWGYNADGEIGNGATALTNVPVPVSGNITFKSISAGYVSSCGVSVSGAAYCWGDNTYGELGNGTTTNSLVPVAVGGGFTWASVSVGDAYACGVTTSGAAYCWGYNSEGQLGNGKAARSSTPVPVSGNITFAPGISAGYSSACAVTPGGAAYCWGSNLYGQLGNQTASQQLSPVLVVTPPQ